MSEKLNISQEDKIKKVSEILQIPNRDQLKQVVFPSIPMQPPDLFAPVKQNTADIVIRNIGFPFLQNEIYKGRIPIGVPRDEPITSRKSMLNTPIFSDLQFVEVGGLKHIPIDCVLFDVKQAKNIVRTQINGRDGTVKEYIGEDDFEVNIRGVIMGPNGVYPYEQVANLVEFLRLKQSVGIISSFLNNLFDITEVVIKEYSFEQNEGSQSHQKFEILAYSDKPVEVLIQEAK